MWAEMLADNSISPITDSSSAMKNSSNGCRYHGGAVISAMIYKMYNEICFILRCFVIQCNCKHDWIIVIIKVGAKYLYSKILFKKTGIWINKQYCLGPPSGAIAGVALWSLLTIIRSIESITLPGIGPSASHGQTSLTSYKPWSLWCFGVFLKKNFLYIFVRMHSLYSGDSLW
jgi:hypothetical protein